MLLILMIQMTTSSCLRRNTDSGSKVNFLSNKTEEAKNARAKLALIDSKTRRISCTTNTLIASYFNAESPFQNKDPNNLTNITKFESTTLVNFLELLSLTFRNDKCKTLTTEEKEQNVALMGILDLNGDNNTLIMSFHFGWSKLKEGSREWEMKSYACWNVADELKELSETDFCQNVMDHIKTYLNKPGDDQRNAILSLLKKAKTGLLSEIHSQDLPKILGLSKTTLAKKYLPCNESQIKENGCKFDRSVYVMQGHGMPIAEPIKLETDLNGTIRSYGPNLNYFAYGRHHSLLRKYKDSNKSKKISTITNRRALFPDGFPSKQGPSLIVGAYDKCVMKQRVCRYFREYYLLRCLNIRDLLKDQKLVAQCFPRGIEATKSRNPRERQDRLRRAIELSAEGCLGSLNTTHFDFEKEECTNQINFYREKCTQDLKIECEPYEPELFKWK